MEPVAWPLRQVVRETAAPPSRKTATKANVDVDMTAGTVHQPKRQRAVTNTKTATLRRMNMNEVMRNTLSGRQRQRDVLEPSRDIHTAVLW